RRAGDDPRHGITVEHVLELLGGRTLEIEAEQSPKCERCVALGTERGGPRVSETLSSETQGQEREPLDRHVAARTRGNGYGRPQRLDEHAAFIPLPVPEELHQSLLPLVGACAELYVLRRKRALADQREEQAPSSQCEHATPARREQPRRGAQARRNAEEEREWHQEAIGL